MSKISVDVHFFRHGGKDEGVAKGRGEKREGRGWSEEKRGWEREQKTTKRAEVEERK